jgi:hypothetical protein
VITAPPSTLAALFEGVVDANAYLSISPRLPGPVRLALMSTVGKGEQANCLVVSMRCSRVERTGQPWWTSFALTGLSVERNRIILECGLDGVALNVHRGAPVTYRYLRIAEERLFALTEDPDVPDAFVWSTLDGAANGPAQVLPCDHREI